MKEYILKKGIVTLEELVSVFQISLITVRRDLNELEEHGQIRKIYGGAMALEKNSVIPLEERVLTHRKEKERIGLLAASLVEDNTTIFVDSGSTSACIISHLAAKQNITIVTHSLAALIEAATYKSLNLVSIGGYFSPSTASFVGGAAQNALSEMNIQTAFMGASGVSLEKGLSNSVIFEAEIKRCIVAHSKRIILMADHHKFGHNALLSFCPLERLNEVVCDCAPGADFIEFFERKNISLICDI